VDVQVELNDGSKLPGRVVAVDPDSDLAAVMFLCQPGQVVQTPALYVATKQPKAKAPLRKLGHPLAGQLECHEGACVGELGSVPPLYDAGMTVTSGDSGGCVVDAGDCLCGVVSGHRPDDPQRKCWAVPVPAIRKFLATLQTETAPPPLAAPMTLPNFGFGGGCPSGRCGSR
jgi:S1-C subfamily serine protease